MFNLATSSLFQVLGFAFLLPACNSLSILGDPMTMQIPRGDASSADAGVDAFASSDASAADGSAGDADQLDAQVPDSHAETDAGDLIVNIEGVPNRNGTLASALFSQQESSGFSEGAPMRGDWIAIPGASFPLVFDHLPPGRYAVIVYHDENGNRSLDKGIFGQPMERWGATNNVRHTFSGPTFNESSVVVTAGQRTQTTVLVR